jgi:SAM-dependent methyltransferase
MSSSDSLADHHDHVQFSPPLHRQRYDFVLNEISRDLTLQSLLDIGCGTCQLLRLGKFRNPHVQLAVAIDINSSQLDESFELLKPLPIEYVIYRRETPFELFFVHGRWSIEDDIDRVIA